LFVLPFRNIESEASRALFWVIPTVSFCIFLISGFMLLMLVKERSDMLVQEMQQILKKRKSNFSALLKPQSKELLFAMTTFLQCLG
jgi:hypothetical protein